MWRTLINDSDNAWIDYNILYGNGIKNDEIKCSSFSGLIKNN